MDLTLSAEEEAVRDAIRTVLVERSGMARVRVLTQTRPARDESVWQAAGELGWFGLALSEPAGGAGYGVVEEMLLATELGRSLAPGPWLGTMLAAHALADVAPLRRVHAAVLGGQHPVALVDDPDDQLGSGAELRGTLVPVPDAGLALGLLVLRRNRADYLTVPAPGVRLSERGGMDATRHVWRITCENAIGHSLAIEAGTLRRRATVLAAAEALGVAERTLEQSVEYAKVRQQFGKPIGSFQAIKHRCADMAVRVEAARSLVAVAAVALNDGLPEAPLYVHAAKTLATNAALANATDNVQNHGGMGFTWENDAHYFLKRAWLLEHTCGTRARHLDAIAAPWRASAGRS